MTSTNPRPEAKRPEILVASDLASIARAADALRNGELIVLPTDTVYGLAASYGRPEAVARIYQVKRRPAERPIALLVDRFEQVELVASDVSPLAIRLMETFWPGGLTLVLPSCSDVPDIVTAGGRTVAVRMPDHPVPRSISRVLQQPLPTTSANRSGRPSPITAGQAWTELAGDVGLFLDGGKAPGGVDSTVLDLTRTPPVILRAGALTIEALRSIAPEVTLG